MESESMISWLQSQYSGNYTKLSLVIIRHLKVLNSLFEQIALTRQSSRIKQKINEKLAQAALSLHLFKEVISVTL